MRVVSRVDSFHYHEVSLLTILHPEGFDCETGRSNMICVIYAINRKVVAMHDMYVYTGRKAICYVTERSGMMYDICAMCARLNVLCVVNVMGRKAICYGPEGNMLRAGRQYVMGRKAIMLRAGRQCIVDRKVRAWKGVYV